MLSQPMTDNLTLLEKIQKQTGINLSKKSKEEFELAIKGDQKALFESYANRLKTFLPYMSKDAQRQTFITIQNLSGQLK